MNWPRAVESNKDEALSMLAVVFAMLGAGETVLRHMRRAILFTLLPAESIARRLIAIVALDVTVVRWEKRVAPSVTGPKGERGERAPVFRLFDRRRNVDPVAKHPPGGGPGVWFLDGEDRRGPGRKEPLATDPVSVASLRRRTDAVFAALNDIPAQAQRLARITAALERPIRAMRPGRPPGYNARGRRPIDILLADCHELALMAYAERDRAVPVGV